MRHAHDTAPMTKEAFLQMCERADGPPVLTFWGSHSREDRGRMGTRELDWHAHRRGQLFCVANGLVHVRTAHGSWMLPPLRAGWLPPGMMHKVTISGVLDGWGMMLTPEACAGLPDTPCVMGISDLLRSLVRRVTEWPPEAALTPEQERLLAVLLDEVRLAPREPLHLPMPTDPRLLRLALRLLEAPDDDRTLAALARDAGLSERTARRQFVAETGLSVTQWRQQARLTLALERLAKGEAVAEVADALGYATPSNFIAMFRRAFGESPARYFARREAAA
ncbi:helix-turn-helix transcriptional regulator [Nitrospirillum sp. BR 11163]|uniref:AraC family transcriptional regulator n=1 Tax=Nitrospirillum sp. BR 11163 TaxID=3104323 RepID=UPI002AFDD1F0|nr:helix-turn-helix transcriptional regulator [Nitrospirillum sp. BR 11163]MEA1677350.1 helix-turn-helix transcriptional regulator [Nitrospirillum sp. BR 11163]